MSLKLNGEYKYGGTNLFPPTPTDSNLLFLNIVHRQAHLDLTYPSNQNFRPRYHQMFGFLLLDCPRTVRPPFKSPV